MPVWVHHFALCIALIPCCKLGAQMQTGSSVATVQLAVQSKAEAHKSAETAFAEGMRLMHEGSGESLAAAIDSFRTAGADYGLSHDTEKQADALTWAGSISDELGRPQEALMYYRQALMLRRSVGDRTAEAKVLNNLGGVYANQGDEQKAKIYYSEALALSRATRDRAGEAVILNNLGGLYDNLGEPDQALDYYNHALTLRRAVGDRAGEAVTLYNICSVYSDLGRREEALDCYGQTLQLEEMTGDHLMQAKTLNNLAVVQEQVGRVEEALKYYNQALLIEREVADCKEQATTLNNIGRAYSALGMKVKALDSYDQALALERVMGDHSGEASTLNSIGRVFSDSGEYSKSQEYYAQALTLERATGAYGLRVWNANTGMPEMALSESRPVLALAISKDGKTVSSTTGSDLTIWDLDSGQRRCRNVSPYDSGMRSLAFSPKGGQIVTIDDGGRLMQWDIYSCRQLSPPLLLGKNVTGGTFSPDGRLVASTNGEGVVRIWEVSTGNELFAYSSHGRSVTSAAFSPDGRRLAAGTSAGSIDLWDLPTGRQLLAINATDVNSEEGASVAGAILALTFSPDGAMLAAGSADRTCKLWRTATGELVRTFYGHTLSIVSVAFQPDGRRLMTGGLDHSVKFWDVATGKVLRTLTSPDGTVSAVALSGTRLVTATDFKVLHESTLYILAIGIGRYQNNNIMNLRYPAIDASTVAKILSDEARGQFDRVAARVLLDANATRKEILAAMKSIAEEAQPTDTLVFYFAGNSDSQEPILLPSDVVVESRAALIKTGIDSGTLSSLLAQTAARRQLVLLDTVNAAAVFSSFTDQFKKKNPELLALMDRSTTILAASSVSQTAYEDSSLGHGVFTYAVLEGLGGRAIASDSDSTVTAFGLSKYVMARVPDLVRAQGNMQKQPAVYSYGNDFPLFRLGTKSNPQDRPQGLSSLTSVAPSLREAGFREHRHPRLGTGVQIPQSQSNESRGFESIRPAASSQPLPARHDYALIFANNTYDPKSGWGGLTYPLQDAHAVGTALQTIYKFDVEIVPDASQETMVGALRKYVKRKYGPEDQLLVFFAGHGDEDDVDGYIVAANSNRSDENKLSYISYSISGQCSITCQSGMCS